MQTLGSSSDHKPWPSLPLFTLTCRFTSTNSGSNYSTFDSGYTKNVFFHYESAICKLHGQGFFQRRRNSLTHHRFSQSLLPASGQRRTPSQHRNQYIEEHDDGCVDEVNDVVLSTLVRNPWEKSLIPSSATVISFQKATIEMRSSISKSLQCCQRLCDAVPNLYYFYDYLQPMAEQKGIKELCEGST
ncbi:hypothetical protein E2542_SST09092 [Spatholobus suberectus]|nr:hypothetical protein E2542_SST09092 [Spatholobus suberectus]